MPDHNPSHGNLSLPTWIYFIIIVIFVVIAAVMASFLTTLQTDTRPNAFLTPDNPALLYREKVREQFGLSDPLVIALVDRGPYGVFNPSSLELLHSLSDQISAVDNIDDARVTSIVSEKHIKASPEGMEIEDFLDPLPETQAEADKIRAAVFDFPLLVGNLVSQDGSIAVIVAELLDESQVEKTYDQVRAIADSASNRENVEVHIAGEGAIAGYLSRYIDIDAKRLNPIAWAVIMLILFIAYRRLSVLLLANVIIAASIVISLGLMAAVNIPFYMITTILPVILIGISVADTIHIYSRYFELQAQNPDADKTELVARTMRDMWRPVTLTTLTTMAGFLGFYFFAYMPPFKYFGLFTAIGVAVAWLYSLVFLPTAMILTRPRASKAYLHQVAAAGSDWFGRAMQMVGKFTRSASVALVAATILILFLGSMAASRIIVDEDPITIFHSSEPLYQADKIINGHMAGTNALDIVIEAKEPGGLLSPENLRRIEELQKYAESLPHVGGTTSIVDYLKQMNRAINGGAREYYTLPDSEELVAQYFLIYSATSDPTDFEEEIDYDYRLANVRLNMNTGSYQKFKPVVEALQQYIDRQFNSANLKATLSGRVNLNYHWIGDLGRSHFVGLWFALLLVWMMSSLLFRSTLAGVYTLIPVAGAILLVYAAMVILDIRVGVGTSMFAAVALGLGVDFSIHTLERFRVIYEIEQGNWERVFDTFYKSTGRALFFNFLAIACGFGVLISSQVSSLNNFGMIIVVAISTSFLSSITVLPAIIRVFHPGFITDYELHASRGYIHWRTLFIVAAVVVAAWLIFPREARSQEPLVQSVEEHDPSSRAISPTAEQIVKRVNAVDDGKSVTRYLTMQLIDSRGKERVRDTVVYRKYFEEEMQTIMFYLSPANVRNTSFLTWDYPEPDKDDDQWLYLPALRKVRRISSADRGDYFMGTDFTYEDIKLDGKLSHDDYTFRVVGRPDESQPGYYKLEGIPRSDDIAAELGYSRIEFLVDEHTWLVVEADFYDIKHNQLKAMKVTQMDRFDGIWARQRIEVENHKTGHRTIFTFSDIDYQTPVEDSLFTKGAMERGIP